MKYKEILFVFPMLLLCACGTCQPEMRPVEVDIPVPVSCISDIAPEPGWNIALLSQSANAVEKLKAAFADLQLSRGYIEELQAEVAACG